MQAGGKRGKGGKKGSSSTDIRFKQEEENLPLRNRYNAAEGAQISPKNVSGKGVCIEQGGGRF